MKKIFFVVLLVVGLTPAIAFAQEDDLGDEGDQSLEPSRSVGTVSDRYVPIEGRWYAKFAPGGVWINTPANERQGYFDLNLGALKINRNQAYGFEGTLGFGGQGLQMITAGGFWGLGDLTGFVHVIAIGRLGLLRLPGQEDEYGMVSRIGGGILAGWSLMQFGLTGENVCVWFVDYKDPIDAVRGFAVNAHFSYSF